MHRSTSPGGSGGPRTIALVALTAIAANRRTCPIDPLDNATQSDRVYVLKHRGPRKRRGSRSNPEAKADVGFAGNG